MKAKQAVWIGRFLSAFALATALGGLTANGETSMKDWKALLEEVVNINSGTQNIDGLEAVRQVLIPEFEKLGLEATTYDLDDGHKLLTMAAPDAKPEVLLMGHIDTVFPKESEFQRFALQGDRLYGPGVIDMKGGIVLMRDLIANFSGTDELKKFVVMINDDEEIGSPYSKELLKKLGADIKAGLVFEPGLPDGAVVTSHSGVYWLTLAVEGKAAHAGLEPQLGINACVELSDKVVRLATLSDYDKKLSVNVGKLDGGTKRNVVCEVAKAGIDIRFVEKDDLEKTLAAIQTITDEMTVYNNVLDAAPAASLETLVATPSMPGARTERLYALLQQAGKAVGQQVSGRHVGYTSDANHLADTGMDLLVGLGPYGAGMHTDEEFLTVSTFGERLALTEALVRQMLGR